MEFISKNNVGKLEFESIDEHKHFLQEAFSVSTQTDDPKSKINKNSAVGCIIVKNGKILSSSANILHERIKKSKLINDNLEKDRYHFIEHAERSAIFRAVNSGNSLIGSYLYCTRFPCSDCTRAIIATGISKIFLPENTTIESQNSVWHQSQTASNLMLTEANVSILYVDMFD